MDSPYRDLPGASPAEAPTREGRVRVEEGPHHVRLQLGDRWRLTVSGAGAIWARRKGGGERRRELPLGRARLWVARSHPTRDLAIWYEVEPGVVERLGGARPVPFSEPDALGAWRALDKVAERLVAALEPWSGGAREAVELGRGQHRVLVVAPPDRLVLYARPIFRERPRRALEVCSDGTLVIPGRRADRRGRFYTRLGVSASGDRICFADRQDELVAAIWLPWIAPEDRQELARRFGELVDPTPPEPDAPPWRKQLGPWVSGLGRPPPMASFGSRPLPNSIAGLFRR